VITSVVQAPRYPGARSDSAERRSIFVAAGERDERTLLRECAAHRRRSVPGAALDAVPSTSTTPRQPGCSSHITRIARDARSGEWPGKRAPVEHRAILGHAQIRNAGPGFCPRDASVPAFAPAQVRLAGPDASA
jgi:hypothetical protein